MTLGLNGLKGKKIKKFGKAFFHSNLLSLWSILNHPWTRHGEAAVNAEALRVMRVLQRLHPLVVNCIHECRCVVVHEVQHGLQHKAAARVRIHIARRPSSKETKETPTQLRRFSTDRPSLSVPVLQFYLKKSRAGRKEDKLSHIANSELSR